MIGVKPSTVISSMPSESLNSLIDIANLEAVNVDSKLSQVSSIFQGGAKAMYSCDEIASGP